MKAVVLHRHGGVDALRYQDFPEPLCSKDEVLVKVHACSVNRLDVWVRKGLAGREVRFPHILGCDISGYLESDVDHPNLKMKKGSKVVVYPMIHCGSCRFCRIGKENRCTSNDASIIGGFSSWHGGYAEYLKVPVRNIIPLESYLSMDEAASINIAYLTAYSMIKYAMRLRRDINGYDDVTIATATANVVDDLANINTANDNPSLLVYGAGSGIGVASVQFAKAMGYKVIATVGSQDKLEKAYSLGCDLVIDRSKQDIAREVMRFTMGDGVDLVIDHVGIWDTSIKCLKKGSGIMAVCGATASEHTNVEVRPFYNRLALIFGAYLGSKKELVEMLRFMQEHNIRPVIDSAFALEDAALAHTKMETNNHFGKMVIKVASI